MFKETQITNPDRGNSSRDVFTLHPESVPSDLVPLLSRYEFRRCSVNEIDNSAHLTQNAWPGLPESTSLDLRIRNMINAPMCGAFDSEGNMVGYTRLLWGYDNNGIPEIVSHMTAVSDLVRGEGIGQAFKWQARQIALEFPATPVDQLTVTFDNLQGRNCNVNFNKLGIICGSAGGEFKPDIYGGLTGEQHKGNPTDRYQGRWYLNSEWTRAHLERRVRLLSAEDIRAFPRAISFIVNLLDENSSISGNPVPIGLNLDIEEPFLVMPTPLDWDNLLAEDKQDNYNLTNLWRQVTRKVIINYHNKGYTTVAAITDKERGINLQLFVLNFDSFNPPSELLK